jgi:hypothetical protein
MDRLYLFFGQYLKRLEVSYVSLGGHRLSLLCSRYPVDLWISANLNIQLETGTKLHRLGS